MIQSHDEPILEMAEEYGLSRMGENNEDEDDDDEGNAISPLAPAPAVMPKEIVEEEAPVENGPHELDDLPLLRTREHKNHLNRSYGYVVMRV
jgi:hypothetical protein